MKHGINTDSIPVSSATPVLEFGIWNLDFRILWVGHFIAAGSEAFEESCLSGSGRARRSGDI
jgi:hypothetical protein